MTTNVTVDLIRALVENMTGAPDDWTSFAMVLRFDTERVNGMFGYAYSDDASETSVTASPYAIRSVVKAYTDSYYEPGQPLPVSLLVQFDRVKGAYEVTFEDSDQARWKVTPANFADISEELRSRFE